MRVKAVVLFCGFLMGCSPTQPQTQKLEGMAQGTTYHITYWSNQAVDNQLIETAIKTTFEDIDKNISNYRPDSVIEAFNANQSTKSQEVGAEIIGLVRLAQSVHQLSSGCFDLTVKPLFDLWGFKGEALTIPSNEALQQTLAQVGMKKIEIVDDSHLLKTQADVRVDLSAIGQGYTVGKVSEALELHGVTNYLVEIGGELKTNGHKPDGLAWRVAVEKPLPGERKIHKVVTMPKDAPMSVMASGTYRHYYELNGQRYSHILDARTGKPVTHDLVAVTVLNENPTVADAWSTALLCLGQQDGIKLANAEKINAIFIRQRGSEFLETRSEALNTATNLAIQ